MIAAWLYALHFLRRSPYAVAFFGLFSTIMHEACHFIVGLLLRAKPVSVSLWPRKEGNAWVLGYVAFSNITLWNAAFVGLAPLLMFPLGWLLFLYWTIPSFAAGWHLSWALSGYVVACCIFGGLPSTTDIKVAFASAFLYGLAFWVLYHFFS
jgi:hypothetical protein